MKKVSRMLLTTLAAMAALSLGLTGCGSSTSTPAQATAAKTVTISGSLENGTTAVAKEAAKSVESTAVSHIGSVAAVDAATGAVISTSDAEIGSDGKFSITITPPSTQAGVILKAALHNATFNNGKTYRALITDTLSPDSTFTGKKIGPTSDAAVALVLEKLGADKSGVTLPSGTTLDTVKEKLASEAVTAEKNLAVGYVINTGGSATAKQPGVSILDRKTNTITKTVRFTNGIASSGHFANVNPDGTELWLCTNDPNGGVGTVHVIKTATLAAPFSQYSTINSSNKNDYISASFNVGCGIQSTQTPDGRYLFTSSNQGSKGINVFDVKKREYLGNIANGNTAPHVGAVSADGKTYYTTTAEKSHAVGYDISGLPAKVPTDADKKLDVDLGYGNLHALRIHPNSKYLFVGNNTWPVPAGKTSTSGLNVIDLTSKSIIKNLPGRPHNYTVSPDGKYLSSTDNSSGGCNYEGDVGSLVQFIDISTLLTATPDLSSIVTLYQFERTGYAGSHAGWDATTGLYYYSTSDSTGQGWLYTLNTANLAAKPTASVSEVTAKQKIGWAPHGVSFAGINGD